MANSKENPDVYEFESDVEAEDLLDAVLEQPEASTWKDVDYSERWCTFTLSKSSPEYNAVVAKFRETCNFTIKKVVRVQNPFMLGQFLLKREEMQKAGPVKTLKLFHGTSEDCLENIYDDNLDWKRYGDHKGTRHGEGVNFTPRARFAAHFGDRRVMILADVLVGKTCVGSQDMQLPEGDADAAIRPDGDVIVKFDEDEFYPAYVLHYYPRKEKL